MPVKLATRTVEKPWGRDCLPAPFSAGDGRRIGEIWFEGADGARLPLLVKYLFTSERLSIQVHPNDREAAVRGLASGKEECWYILDCEPGASLGIGLQRSVSDGEMRAALADGSVERLIDWKPVSAGDFFLVSAGTVHAIGAGVALVEVQQNADATYRLHDYGRPRELHLEDGLAVANLAPYAALTAHAAIGESRALLPAGAAPFAVDLRSWTASEMFEAPAAGSSWFVPLKGSGTIDGQIFRAGECWLADGTATVRGDSPGTALIAWPDPAWSVGTAGAAGSGPAE